MSYFIEHFSQNMRQYIQNKYDSVVNLCEGNGFYLDVYVTMIIFLTVYWTVGALFSILDLTKWPKFLYQYKIQDEKVTIAQMVSIIPRVLFNQIVVTFLFSSIGYYLLQLRGYKSSPEIPTLFQMIKDWIALHFFQEIVFYYTHRSLHNPRIYKYIHKTHHEWSAPIAIAAHYCHPFEQFYSNLPAGFVGSAIMQPHRLTAWLWVIWGSLETLITHSGYHFPLLISPVFHDYHHSNFTGNYGVNGLLDRIHGTDQMFRKSKAFSNYRLWTLKFMKYIYPDSSIKINDKKRKNK